MERLIFMLVLSGMLRILSSCSGIEKPPVKTPDDLASVEYRAQEAFPGLKFTQPVDFGSPRDGTNRLFVVEQAGTIRVFENNTTTSSSTVFLDISDRVTSGGERGLLGLAFHPDFKNNGFFFVNYTRGNPLETVIARFKAVENKTSPETEQILLSYRQPQSNHNGGGLIFGKDGYLYIGSGDGGGASDPQNYAQNLSSLLGKIIRIDVNSNEKGNYGIPADNPFKGNQQGFKEEIYAYGMRNPWRISFDEATNRLWAGDVGQGAKEEIDIIAKGGNYGWRKKEGNNCYNPSSNCDEAAFIPPVWEYGRNQGDVSITGGFVYRGQNIPSLQGKYIYGDYASGRIWALQLNEDLSVNKNTLLLDNGGSISSFGTDAAQEMFYCQYSSGKIMKLSTTK